MKVASFHLQVQNFLVHFWQGIPAHISMILTHNSVIDLIGQCDNILYKVSFTFHNIQLFIYIHPHTVIEDNIAHVLHEIKCFPMISWYSL